MNFQEFWASLEAKRLKSTVHFNYLAPIITNGRIERLDAHIGDRVTDLKSVCGIFRKGGDQQNILDYGLARVDEIKDRDDVIALPCRNVNLTHPKRYER